MDLDRLTDRLRSEVNVKFSPRVTNVISEVRDGKEAVRQALSLILQTFYLASSKRRGPKGKVIHFSANIGDRGRVRLIKVRAKTTFDTGGKVIEIDLPEAEWTVMNKKIVKTAFVPGLSFMPCQGE